jgi:Putative peptidoglycan binding domain
MSSNPNPAYITDALWRLWDECAGLIPGVRLGGIYAAKSCYHNTVWANQSNWPGAYCIECGPDLTGPMDKARAIDLTMDDEQMRLRSGYLKAAAVANDGRMHCLREWIGTTDSYNVHCYIHDSETGSFRYDGGRDDSHLWHVHLSVFTKYCGTWDGALDGVLDVLAGGNYVPPVPPQPGDAPAWPFASNHYLGQPDSDPACHSGYYSETDRQVVAQWQAQMAYRGWSIGADGYYGPQSQDTAAAFQAEKGLDADGLVGPQTWAASWTASIT